MKEDKIMVGANIQIPEDLNWRIKEEAMRRKTTKEQAIILLLGEVLK